MEVHNFLSLVRLVDTTFIVRVCVFLSQSLQELSLFVSLLISVSLSPFLGDSSMRFCPPNRLAGSPLPHSEVGGGRKAWDPRE